MISIKDKIPKFHQMGKYLLRKIHQGKLLSMHKQLYLVGNIHPKIGPSYILHLFDQFEPLAITEMQNIPSTRIR